MRTLSSNDPHQRPGNVRNDINSAPLPGSRRPFTHSPREFSRSQARRGMPYPARITWGDLQGPISKGGRMRSRKRSQWVIVGSAAVLSASVGSIGGVASAGPVAPGQTVQQAFGDQPEFQFTESLLSGLTLVSQGSQSFETTVVP